jgi:hypothetical protein
VLITKTGGISNLSRPFELVDEGDLEQETGIGRTSSLNGRDQSNKRKSQIDFRNFICLPLYSIIANLYPTLNLLLDCLMRHFGKWNELVAAQARPDHYVDCHLYSQLNSIIRTTTDSVSFCLWECVHKFQRCSHLDNGCSQSRSPIGRFTNPVHRRPLRAITSIQRTWVVVYSCKGVSSLSTRHRKSTVRLLVHLPREGRLFEFSSQIFDRPRNRIYSAPEWIWPGREDHTNLRSRCKFWEAKTVLLLSALRMARCETLQELIPKLTVTVGFLTNL